MTTTKPEKRIAFNWGYWDGRYDREANRPQRFDYANYQRSVYTGFGIGYIYGWNDQRLSANEIISSDQAYAVAIAEKQI